MFGRLKYSPDEYYRMGWVDLMAAIEGFNDQIYHELNMLRHGMWASLAAFQGDKAPRPSKILPLPMDNNSDNDPVTKEYFMALAKRMAELDKNKMAKA